MQFTGNFAFDRLSESAQIALRGALVTRGPRQGLLRKTAPNAYTPGYIGWQALMMELCPSRVSVGGLMFMSAAQREVFEECTKYCAGLHRYINENLQRPLEFNLYHFNN